MRLPLVLVLTLLAPPVLAQGYAVRDSDEILDGESLTGALLAAPLRFFDDGESRFSPGGSYSYTYSRANGGGRQFGTWAVTGPGLVCIAYRNGFDRCDMYVRAGGRLVVLTEDGDRYPVRDD